MPRFSLVLFSTALLASTVRAQPVTVTLTLESSQAGQTVLPGAVIDWTIRASLPTSGSAGLALVGTDLAQGSPNPAFIDLPAADGVPAGMENFSRPQGVSNPGEDGASTGYIGVQRSPTGKTYENLVQIGGGQNTFGTTLPVEYGVAQSAAVVSGVGQDGTPQIVASGSFPAPGAQGTYTFQLENAAANVLDAVGSPPIPPAHWPVSPAAVNLAGASFSFEVVDELRGDLNCDGLVNTADISHFVQALVDPAGYDADHDGSPHPVCLRSRADLNDDTREDGEDIQSFVDLLLGA